MKQFDLFENPSLHSRDVAPFLMVLPSHHVVGLEEVVVAPVVRSGRLTPNAVDVTVQIDDQTYVVSVVGLAAVRQSILKRRVGNLMRFEFDIRRALDRLFTGF